jgi:DNA-binding MarR family transcriptional regulator
LGKPTSILPAIGEGKRGAQGRLGYLLRQAAGTQRQLMDRAMADLGVTAPQFVVLTLVNAYPGISSADLARLAYLTPQTVSLIVANLERAGAIGRRAHDVHGRVQELHVTQPGRALLARCKRRVDGLEDSLLAGLSAREQQIIRSWLVRVALKGKDAGEGKRAGDQASKAATPGRVLPSSHSRKAPPAVET